MTNKKNLSLLDYLEALQKEYFISESRSKFYYNPKNRQYYNKVCGFKKEKILKIQNENNIPTIFSSESEYKRIKELTLTPKGLPIDMDPYDYTDVENYYSKGSDVKCFTGDNEFSLGKIVNFNKDSNIILVKLLPSGKEVEFSRRNCWRLIN